MSPATDPRAQPAAPLRARLRRALGDRTFVLDAVLEAARRAGVELFLVGGPVRDLLLGSEILDLDLLVSDHLERVAVAAARALRAPYQVRPRFLTATVEAGPLRIDLARARTERYPRPGALPLVRAAGVDDDLGRRDFTLHALALPLDASSGDRLLDPHGGLADLGRRELRVLHPRSFEDDPTRLLRAARYAARLRFALAPGTLRLAREAIRAGALDSVSGDRLRAEITRLLEEPRPASALREAAALGLAAALSPGWAPDRACFEALERFARAQARPPWPRAADPEVRRAAGFRLLALGARPAAARGLVARLAFTGGPAGDLLRDVARLPRLLRTLRRELAPGALDALLHGEPDAMLLAASCALATPHARAVARYATTLRSIPSPMDGHVARGLGARGTEIGRLLRAARRRALDGRPVEHAWARGFVARLRRMG